MSELKIASRYATALFSKAMDDKAIEAVMADILVVALGKPGFVTEEMVKEGAVVIDVGTTRVDDATRKSGWRLRGDVDYDAVLEKVSAITPVPKGVGPMTITGLMMNTLEVYKAKFA